MFQASLLDERPNPHYLCTVRVSRLLFLSTRTQYLFCTVLKQTWNSTIQDTAEKAAIASSVYVYMYVGMYALLVLQYLPDRCGLIFRTCLSNVPTCLLPRQCRQ